MGKPISARLFTDTKYGRIYICCKVCVKDIHEDLEKLYKASYPTVTKLDNKLCPVTGKELVKDSPTVLLQGREFRVYDREAAKLASEDAQWTLARLLEPSWVDVGNRTCPVNGGAVQPNTIVVYDNKIVRLSSTKAIEEFRKDPKLMLAKALEIRAKQDAAERKQEPKAKGMAH